MSRFGPGQIDEICWWCGAVADSREHRFKRSRLKKHLGAGPGVSAGDWSNPEIIQGPNAKSMKFPKVLCRRCNNDRSSPFDRAYDVFADFISTNPEYFRFRYWVDLTGVFGSDDLTNPANLCRYYIKNMGCRIAETGFKVPSELSRFLDGASQMPNSSISLYSDYSVFDQFRRRGNSIKDSQYPFANRMFAPRSPEDGPLEGFAAEVQDGPVGALYWYAALTELGKNFASQCFVPIRSRIGLPHHELHQSEWDSAAWLAAHQS